jgi:hypothetical protein
MTSVDNGIGDGLVGRRSMTFQESFDKDSIDGMSNDDNDTAHLGAKLGAKRKAKQGAKQGTK